MRIEDFAALARSDASDDAVLAAADRTAQETVGHGLMTVMRFHPATMEVERLYSSNPEAYPPGGRKPKKDTEWGRQVLLEGRVHAGGEAAIRAAFTDHETIAGLGLSHVVNVPIRQGRQTLGTLNLLSGSIDYARRDTDPLERIAALLERCVTGKDRP